MQPRNIVRTTLAVAVSATLSAVATGQPAPLAPPAPRTEPATADSPAARFEPQAPDLDALGIDVHPNGLTADEAARRALAASPGVREKHAELQTANLRIRQNTLQFMPQLTLTASYTRLSPVSTDLGGSGSLVGAANPGLLTTGPCPGGAGDCVLDSAGQPVAAASFNILPPNNNYVLNAKLSIPLSDYALRITHAAAATSASREASRYALEAEKLAVSNEARVLFHNWLRAQLQVDIARESLRRNQARYDDAKLAFDVGTSSKADVLRIETLVVNGELTLAQAEKNVALANGQLAVAMADASGKVYRPGEAVASAAAPAATRPGAVQRMIADAHSRRLELKSLAAQARALKKGASATRAARYPRIEAVGDVTYANPNPRFFPPQNEWNATWSAGVVATWNVFESFLNEAKSDEYASQAEATLAREQAVRAAVAQEVITAHLDVQKAQLAAESSGTQLRVARDAYDMTIRLYAAGKATTTDIIATETDLLSAQLMAIDAQVDLKIASLRLSHARGLDVPNPHGG